MQFQPQSYKKSLRWPIIKLDSNIALKMFFNKQIDVKNDEDDWVKGELYRL